MKTTTPIITTIFLFAFVLGQDNTNKTMPENLKTNTLGVSAIWAAFGFMHIEYSKIIENGKKEYGIMLGTFGYEESYDDVDIIEDYSYGFKGASGHKASYRIYRKEGAKGLFLQAEFGLLNYIWGHKKENSDWTDVNTFVYNPSLVIGYKYNLPFLNKRFFVEPDFGVGYTHNDPKDGGIKYMGLDDDDDDESTPDVVTENGSKEFGPDFNLKIGFHF